MKHHETVVIRCDDIGARCRNVGARCGEVCVWAATSAIARRSFDATISALDAETSAIARSYRRYQRGVSGNIGDCRVGITPQMCNRVTNHGDMSTFSKPVIKFQCFVIFSSNLICHVWSHPNKLLCVSREWGTTTIHLPYETLIFNKESMFSVNLESKKCNVHLKAKILR